MRKSIPRRTQIAVWYRDGWHCHYCGEALFFSPSLKLLHSLSPGHGYYDQHGKRQSMLKILEDRCACCDHVIPVAKGGDNSIDNLVAACFSCNREKSAGELRERPLNLSEFSTRPSCWDGFASIYSKLDGGDKVWSRLIEVEQTRTGK